MINSRQLWKQRLGREMQEMKRYLRYMFNDHLLFVLLIGIGAGAFAYERWVETLSSQFPYAWVAALFFSFMLTTSSVRTFFQDADIVFLLPVETKLRPYIQRAFVFNFIVQAYVLFLAVLVIAPLHLKFSRFPLWALFLLLLLVKSWNLFISWKGNYFVEPLAQWLSWGTRLLLNALIVYFLLVNVSIAFLLILLFIMIALSVYFSRVTQQKGLKWERLIEQEAKAKRAFYRIANLFIDVPTLKERAKRRRWLDGVLALIPYRQENAFIYLYARTFIRAGDYFAFYVRLTVIALFLLYIVPTGYGKIVTSLFFLYATVIQLFTLSRHYRANIFVKLYPLSYDKQRRAVLHLLFLLLLIQNVLFALFLVVLGDLWLGLLSLVMGVIFSYLLLFMYVQKRWKQGERK
ncbi:ABC transporter permease [Thermaerobacillus caldiproteolyticus]|uniref:ABC-2 type transport system permease protein n=1 Tax=Thermaerobacillus caldiproteolyticus TaxID=247480 RepID=A0A7W0BXR0_9BACL|nr:ABC transporter permease [Anoxybacillus caldiproteolyticus]MBA2874806.1 ABC-2 type transport system permease protein [Anoxybacillus caldiproteolyticus]